MAQLVLTSDTLAGTPATGTLEYNGQFFGTDSNASRAQMQRITQGTAVASTSGTSIDFTSIPAWVKRITVMFGGVSTNGTSSIQLQLGDAGGIETSGYLGALIRTGAATAGTTQYPTTGFLVINDVAAADVHVGILSILSLGSNNWVGVTQISETTNTVSSAGSGSKTLSDTLTQIRITTVNGTDTFDAGSVNILYEG